MSKSSSINIYARLRKIMPWEGDTLSCMNRDNTTVINRHGNRQSSYSFSKVFSPNDDNYKVFDDSCVPMLRQVLNGFNAIFMAYGQTGSGKTFSVLGKRKPKQSGVLAISLKWLLQQPNVTKVELSAVETFGHHVQKVALFDLGLPENAIENWEKKRGSTSLSTKNATKIKLDRHNIEDTVRRLHASSHFAPTGKNPESSRGHISYVTRVHVREETRAMMKHERAAAGETIAHWIIVDLAGSEGESALTPDYLQKAEQSEIMARRLEAWCINHGLSQLQLLFGELKGGKKMASAGIGLRRILNEFINNRSFISVLFTISPSLDNAKSTESTLRFAESASLIQCVPVKAKKRVNKDELISQLRQYLQDQQAIIDEQNDKIMRLEEEILSKAEQKEASGKEVEDDEELLLELLEEEDDDDDEEEEGDRITMKNVNVKKLNKKYHSKRKSASHIHFHRKSRRGDANLSNKPDADGRAVEEHKRQDSNSQDRRYSVSSTLAASARTQDLLHKLDLFEKNFVITRQTGGEEQDVEEEEEEEEEEEVGTNDVDFWKVKESEKVSDEDEKQMRENMDEEMSSHRRQSRADASFVSSVLSLSGLQLHHHTRRKYSNPPLTIDEESSEVFDKDADETIRQLRECRLDGFDVNFTLNEENECDLFAMLASPRSMEQIVVKDEECKNGGKRRRSARVMSLDDESLNDLLTDREALRQMKVQDLIFLCQKCMSRYNEMTNEKTEMRQEFEARQEREEELQREISKVEQEREELRAENEKLMVLYKKMEGTKGSVTVHSKRRRKGDEDMYQLTANEYSSSMDDEDKLAQDIARELKHSSMQISVDKRYQDEIKTKLHENDLKKKNCCQSCLVM